MNVTPYTTGWDYRCPRPGVAVGHGRPINRGPWRSAVHRDSRSPGLLAWAARQRANPRPPTEVVRPEPDSRGYDHQPRNPGAPRYTSIESVNQPPRSSSRGGQGQAHMQVKSVEDPSLTAADTIFPRGGTARRARGGRGRGR